VSARRGPITLGIDFSGSATQWQMRAGASAVWIARIGGTKTLRLLDLRRVQDLPGDGPPFSRLVQVLHAGDFSATGIDAPLAPPAGFFAGSRAEFLESVQALPRDGRPAHSSSPCWRRHRRHAAGTSIARPSRSGANTASMCARCCGTARAAAHPLPRRRSR
jgi:hypothetical protein